MIINTLFFILLLSIALNKQGLGRGLRLGQGLVLSSHRTSFSSHRSSLHMQFEHEPVVQQARFELWSELPEPPEPHIILKDITTPEIIIVGDIHGCLVEFEELLEKVAYDSKKHTLILVGDLVNKGLYSAEVVKKARSLNAYCVRGNHDDRALSYLLDISPDSPPPSYDYLKQLDS